MAETLQRDAPTWRYHGRGDVPTQHRSTVPSPGSSASRTAPAAPRSTRPASQPLRSPRFQQVQTPVTPALRDRAVLQPRGFGSPAFPHWEPRSPSARCPRPGPGRSGGSRGPKPVSAPLPGTHRGRAPAGPATGAPARAPPRWREGRAGAAPRAQPLPQRLPRPSRRVPSRPAAPSPAQAASLGPGAPRPPPRWASLRLAPAHPPRGHSSPAPGGSGPGIPGVPARPVQARARRDPGGAALTSAMAERERRRDGSPGCGGGCSLAATPLGRGSAGGRGLEGGAEAGPWAARPRPRGRGANWCRKGVFFNIFRWRQGFFDACTCVPASP